VPEIRLLAARGRQRFVCALPAATKEMFAFRVPSSCRQTFILRTARDVRKLVIDSRFFRGEFQDVCSFFTFSKMDADALRELTELRAVLRLHPELYKKFYEKQACQALSRTVMLSQLPSERVEELAREARRVEYPRGALIVREGVFEEDDAIVIAEGEIRRWASIDGRKHAVDTFDRNSIGMLHLYNRHAARFNAECATPVIAYHIPRKAIDKLLLEHPEMSRFVIQALTEYIRANCFVLSTPLFEQRQTSGTSITATSLGASIDAFYRSAMNNLINERLTGVRGAFFPNMHIQIPARVFYINGLKQARTQVQDYVQATDSQVLRALGSFVPGVAMCPFSSVLEAVNAHMNPEPLWRRALRGYVPRIGREIIFGLGINQLSDYCTERASWISNVHIRGAVGSITSGILAGFFSHVPHNLSTLKLQHPHVSYSDHWKKLYGRYLDFVPPTVTSESQRRAVAQVLCVLFPLGVVRRSIQIGGTFIIINGTIYACRDKKWV
jgi:CRP-like cAMP-binding protein